MDFPRVSNGPAQPAQDEGERSEEFGFGLEVLRSTRAQEEIRRAARVEEPQPVRARADGTRNVFELLKRGDAPPVGAAEAPAEAAERERPAWAPGSFGLAQRALDAAGAVLGSPRQRTQEQIIEDYRAREGMEPPGERYGPGAQATNALLSEWVTFFVPFLRSHPRDPRTERERRYQEIDAALRRFGGRPPAVAWKPEHIPAEVQVQLVKDYREVRGREPDPGYVFRAYNAGLAAGIFF